MNDKSQIENEILAYLRSGPFADDSLLADTDLIQTGLLDSMLVMDLAHFIESQFSVGLDPTDIAPRNLRTVGDMAQCVIDKRNGQSKAA
jgi:acyl carrier protein